jgi:tetratricopeptide (TPR) repeat protein
MLILGRKSGGGSVKKFKNREGQLRMANKRLAQNPRDPEALAVLGDLYFQEESWDRAYKTYGTLAELGNAPGADEFTANLRFALSAQKLNLPEDAYKGFAMAKTINPNNFEVNYNLGLIEFQRKNYEKAIACLNAARLQNPEHAPTLRALGHSYFRLKKSKEAMAHIRKAIELAPDDKESL